MLREYVQGEFKRTRVPLARTALTTKLFTVEVVVSENRWTRPRPEQEAEQEAARDALLHFSCPRRVRSGRTRRPSRSCRARDSRAGASPRPSRRRARPTRKVVAAPPGAGRRGGRAGESTRRDPDVVSIGRQRLVAQAGRFRVIDLARDSWRSIILASGGRLAFLIPFRTLSGNDPCDDQRLNQRFRVVALPSHLRGSEAHAQYRLPSDRPDARRPLHLGRAAENQAAIAWADRFRPSGRLRACPRRAPAQAIGQDWAWPGAALACDSVNVNAAMLVGRMRLRAGRARAPCGS